MRKPLQVGLVALVVLLAVASAVLYSKYQTTSTDLANTKLSQEQVQDRYGRTIEAIAEIQDSLNAISVGEGAQFSGKLQAERNSAGPNREEALDRIAMLRASISQNKDRIRQLESSMKASGIKVAGLQKLIANLKTSVADKETQVAELTQQVEQLQTQVTGLTTAVAETQDTLHTRDVQLEERRRELATVYYVVGSKKELAQTGVISSKGGFLGLGKTVTPTSAGNQNAFTPLDTDEQTVIRTPAEKVDDVKVISAQPPGSYELRLVGGQMELHILNPTEFRKVKQVVILTS